MHVFWNRVRNGRSRSSKVADFGTNRKRVCDFLLVLNSNLGPILLRFSLFQTLCRFSAENITPPLLDPNFVRVPLRLDRRLWGEVAQLLRPRYLSVTDGLQTDGRLTAAIPRNAHRARAAKSQNITNTKYYQTSWSIFVMLNGFHHTSRPRSR